MKILIDPGHGGPFPGAVAQGVREADINLNVAHLLLMILAGAGHEVTMTRSGDYALDNGDKFADIAERCAMANEIEPDLLVSLHCNAADDPRARGLEVWTTIGETESDRAASEILSSLQTAFPTRRFRCDFTDRDGDQEKNFNIISKTSCPAVLVEMGFMTNAEEFDWLQEDYVRENMAHALAQGITNFGAST